ncbi:MAG: adenylate/guanylate cyclase domain-containing protein [Candidatus Zixiibacteriota bacterium]
MTSGYSRLAAWTSPSAAALVETGMLSREGVIAFADISGFTGLTEQLRRTGGRRGVETLTDRVNMIFEGMIAAVHAQGGEVLKFGGDALLLAFGGVDVLERAATCAAELHRVVGKSGRIARGRSLGLHVGMAHGCWQELVAGIPGVRREHFVFGPAVERAMQQADKARDGQTRLWIRPCSQITTTAMSFRRVAACEWETHGHRRARLAAHGAPTGILPDRSHGNRDYVPAQLRAILEDETLDPLRMGEHRRVSTVFVFWRMNAGREKATDQEIWNDVFNAVHALSGQFNGLWARSDPGSGYQKLLVLFGAPASAEDDIERSIEFAMALRRQFSALQSRHRRMRFGVGLTTQTVFTGFVGSRVRMEFTAMGEGVNLAARLASKARAGEILVDTLTKESAQNWDFRPGPELMLKGVSSPVQTWRPLAQRSSGEGSADFNVIEHPRALAEARRLWEEPGANALRIIAGPQLDSRRFVSQLLAELRLADGGVLRLQFTAEDGSHPHGGLGRLIRQVFAHGRISDPIRHLAANSEPVLRRHWDAVLGDEHALEQVIATSSLESYQAKVAGAVTEILFSVLAGSGRPLVVLERLDALSPIDQQVFETFLSVRGGPQRFITTWHGPAAEAPGRGAGSVILDALEKREMRSVLEQIIPPEAISPRLLDFIQAKSGGQPRLARLFIDLLRREGHLVDTGRNGARWRLADLSQVELPDSLRAHYVQRLDRMPRECAHVARAIAVLGGLAPESALRILCEGEVAESQVARVTRYLVDAGLVALDTGGPEGQISIIEPNFLQAAYETMSFAQREILHRRAMGNWRQRGRAGDEQTGRHAFLAHEYEIARPRLMRAARRAHRQLLLDKAQRLYGTALLASLGQSAGTQARLIPALPNDPTPDQAVALTGLADVLCAKGLYPEADRIHSHLAGVHESRRQAAESLRSRLSAGRLAWLGGRYALAERRATRVLGAARRLGATDLEGEAHQLLGEVMRRTGRLPNAEIHLSRAVELFQSQRRVSHLADAWNSRGIVAWNLGHLNRAGRFFRTALSHLRRRRDMSRRGQITNNIGILSEEAGMLQQAGRFYQRAFEIFDAIGHRRNRAYCLGNLANLHRHAARFESARAAYEEAEFELRSIGEQHAAAYTWGNMGDLLRDFGLHERARELYERTLGFARHSDDRELASECFSRFAELSIVEQDWKSARSHIRRAGRLASEGNSKEFHLRAETLDALLELRSGNPELAALMLAELSGETESAGLLYYHLWGIVLSVQALTALGDGPTARRLATGCLSRARRSGYRWWEFHSAVALAEIQCAVNTECNAPAESSLRRASEIESQILQSIGDPAVRDSYQRTPIATALEHTRQLNRQHQSVSSA